MIFNINIWSVTVIAFFRESFKRLMINDTVALTKSFYTEAVRNIDGKTYCKKLKTFWKWKQNGILILSMRGWTMNPYFWLTIQSSRNKRKYQNENFDIIFHSTTFETENETVSFYLSKSSSSLNFVLFFRLSWLENISHFKCTSCCNIWLQFSILMRYA